VWRITTNPFGNRREQLLGRFLVDARFDGTRGPIIPQLPQLLSAAAVVAVDNAGNIWFSRHGIARYNIASAKYDMYIDSFPFIKLPDKQAKALVVDNQDRIWFSSINNGLILYDPVKKTFRHFTKNDGLPDNAVYALTVLENKVWAGCYSGIACVDINDFKVTGFGKEDGLPASNIEQGSRFFYDSVQQQLYLGYLTAIARFNPLAPVGGTMCAASPARKSRP